MVGSKLLLAGSLLLLALLDTAQLLYDSLNDLDNTVVFPGNKADFFR